MKKAAAVHLAVHHQQRVADDVEGQGNAKLWRRPVQSRVDGIVHATDQNFVHSSREVIENRLKRHVLYPFGNGTGLVDWSAGGLPNPGGIGRPIRRVPASSAFSHSGVI